MARQLLMEGWNPSWHVVDVRVEECEISGTLAERAGLPVRAKRTTFDAIVQEGDNPNENKRIYRSKLWERILKADGDFQSRCGRREVLGEVEHPESGNTALDRVAILWENVRFDPKTKLVHGKGIVLETPGGKIINELIAVGHMPAFSSRGQGDVKQTDEGLDEVDENSYYLDTFDAVYKPSVVKARTQSVAVPESHARTESTTHQSRQPMGAVEIDLALDLAPTHRVTAMDTITEVGAGLYARGETVLEAARKAISSSAPTITTLTESQAQISGLIANLGPALSKPSEYGKELLLLKSRLLETSSQVTERIKAVGKTQVQRTGASVAGAQKMIDSVLGTNQALAEQNKKLKESLRRHKRALAEMPKLQAACKVMAAGGQQILDEARALQSQNKDLTERLAAATDLLTEMNAMGKQDRGSMAQTQLAKAKAFAKNRLKENATALAEVDRCTSAEQVKRVLTLVESTGGAPNPNYPADLPPVESGANRSGSLMESGRSIPTATPRRRLAGSSAPAAKDDLMSRSVARFGAK